MTIEGIQPTVPGVPDRVGQATYVEQSRAIAEVAAAVQVAQANPRSIQLARAEMRRSCEEFALADTAFYRYKRGGKTVTGVSVHLARELMRCFGNFQSGMTEMRRDDAFGQSEMQAWAWDVQHNSRVSTVFVVPHANYMTGTLLTDLRSIYENNANQGARREREMVLRLLPSWFVAEAIAICETTLKKGDGSPLSTRQDRAEAALKSIGVDLARAEARVGRPKAQWTSEDLAGLTVDYRSVKEGEIKAEELFPVLTISLDDITPPPPPPPAGVTGHGHTPGKQPVAGASLTGAAPAAQAPQDVPPAGGQPDAGTGQSTPPTPPPPPESGELIGRRHKDALNERFAEMGVRGRGQAYARIVVVRHILGDPAVEALDDLTVAQAETVLGQLAGGDGIRLVVRVLTADGAPEHLVPAAPPTVADVVVPVAPGTAPENDGQAGEVDPALAVDPTLDPGFGVDPAPPAAGSVDERAWYGDNPDEDGAQGTEQQGTGADA